MSNSKGELHRIYWQQWVSSSERKSRRELITSSAGIRISHSGAKAKDVTQLLRDTLKLGNGVTQVSQQESGDHLVLVGTLYSLPRDYVQFEHEQERRLSHSLETQQNSNSTAMATKSPSVSSYPKSDPYHVVKTLHPEDDPLEIKRRMEARLKQLQREAPVSRTIISPKLQWFFIPSSNEKESLIPNCVELDGYCSSLEDEDDDGRSTHSDSISFEDDDEERISSGAEDGASTDNGVDDRHSSNVQSLCSSSYSHIDDIVTKQFPWLNFSQQNSHINAQLNNDPATAHRVKKQRKRRQILHKQQDATVKAQAYAGYLFKQSHRDSNVWRKYFCVITDDYMWYISRIYGTGHGQDKLSYSKHGRIRLTHALLLEPSPDYAPLFRTPFAFELVTGNGTSHVFRASGKALQAKWIQTLSSRIIQSYENSFLDNAELIVADETLVRTQRMESLATDPLWKAIVRANDPMSVDEHVTRMRGHLGAVLRWGMQVSVFKERCRQIQRSLPAKSHVVVTTSLPEPSSRHSSFVSHPIGSVDPFLGAMIESAWTRAAELLARATHVATQLQSRLPHSIEVQCRHIDYMIHGRFRTTSAEDASRSSLGDHQRSPETDKYEKSVSDRNDHRDVPPIDLFDQLLTDLQLLAAKVAISKRVKSDGDQSSSTVDNGSKGIE